ncbi:hypothetical protein JST97_38120 [bacterium]|nr:hypothetical protein [bacterium]
MLKITLMMAALMVGPAFAQPGTHSSSGGKRPPGLRKLISQLELSEKQKAEIQKIMDSGVHGDERRQAIYKVLTPEQANKLKMLIDQQRQQQAQPQ